MRVLFGVLSVALLSACATSTGVGGTGGTDQVAAATAAIAVGIALGLALAPLVAS